MLFCQDTGCRSSVGGGNREPVARLSPEAMCQKCKSLYYFPHGTSIHFPFSHTNRPLKYPDNFLSKSVDRIVFGSVSVVIFSSGQRPALDWTHVYVVVLSFCWQLSGFQCLGVRAVILGTAHADVRQDLDQESQS